MSAMIALGASRGANVSRARMPQRGPAGERAFCAAI
jgi:hypothetical protein